MKKKILLRSLCLVALPSAVLPMVSLASCSKHGLPVVKTAKVKKSLFKELSADGSAYITSAHPAYDVYLFNGSQVPYISVEDYVSTEMQFGKDDPWNISYESVKSVADKQVRITNPFFKGVCTIDYETQTIRYNDLLAYANERMNESTGGVRNPLATGVGGGEQYLRITDSTYVPPNGAYIVPLSDYNIPIYWYKEKMFLPFDIYRNFICFSVERPWFYNGNAFYEASSTNNQTTVDLYKKVREESTVLTKEYAEFCYNNFAMTLDYRYGLDERPSRANPGTTIEYFNYDAYEKLAPFHDDMVSLDPDVSAYGYKCAANSCIDDGGHSGYSMLNLNCTEPMSTVRGPEHAHTNYVRSLMTNSREQMGHTPTDPSGIQIDMESTTGQQANQDIIWITMDHFSAPETFVPYKYVDETNYKNDVVSMTMYVQKLLKDDTTKNIKYVVLDLCCNGGGTVWAENYMASYFGGQTTGVQEVMGNTNTGAFAQYTVQADINQDKKYDADDCLRSDVKLFCITSEFSFSCANLLPCNLADTNKNIKFIGSTTGGGSCYVDANMTVGLGNFYRSSSLYQIGRLGSQAGSFISDEAGNTPTEDYFIPSDEIHALDFFNRAEIIEQYILK